MKRYEFDAVIFKHENIDGAYIEFPYNIEEEFGVKGQVKVKATFDGALYRGSLTKMGMRCHWLGITKEIRKLIGKNPGDKVRVILEQDLEERVVVVPEDFLAAMSAHPDAFSFFEKLSYTHKKEYVQWIESAKKAETRTSRIAKALEMLIKGIKAR
jgi:hypothetical protein